MKKPTRFEKKMKRRKDFFKFILSLILVSLLMVFGLKSDFFIINDIKVIGNNNIKKELAKSMLPAAIMFTGLLFLSAI